MRFTQYFFAPVWLTIAACLALSDRANDVLDNISTVSKTLQQNENAISNYNGGIVAAIPLAQGVYDTWESLRVANANLDDTKFTSEDSDAIVQDFTFANEIAIRLFRIYQEKEPILNQAGVGFVAPILMQALYREADDYAISLKHQMPSEYAAPIDQISANHTEAWEAAFAVYDPARNPALSQQPYKKFYSAMMPVFGMLI
ncbi:unnamed protein product [Penicillium manginii]